MDRPKQVRKVGKPDGEYKIYIEDYAYFYMQNINRTEKGKQQIFSLYREMVNDEKNEMCILGAILQEDDAGGKLFTNYIKVGSACFDELNSEFIFCVSFEKKLVELMGCYIFFAENAPMQSYLVDTLGLGWKSKIHGSTPTVSGTLMTALAVVLCGLCIISMNSYSKMEGLTTIASHLEEAQEISEPFQEEAEEPVQDIPIQDIPVQDNSEETTVSEETKSAIEEVKSVTAEPVEREMTYYVIGSGDTLYSICVTYYGNDDRISEVCQANDIANPDDIKEGQKIILP